MSIEWKISLMEQNIIRLEKELIKAEEAGDEALIAELDEEIYELTIQLEDLEWDLAEAEDYEDGWLTTGEEDEDGN